MAYVFRKVDEETARMIGLLAHSIHAHYPGATIVLLTNEHGKASGVPSPVDVRAAAFDAEFVMLERLRAYRDYVRAVAPGTVVVFMDTDMLVMRRFDELMQPDAQLSVTVRNFSTMPINAGLLVARTDDHARICALFERLYRCCGELTDDERRWYGDQIALERLLAPPHRRSQTSFVAEREGLAVRFAPSRIYNNTPRPWMLALGIYRPGVRVLHFKGERKARMSLYAERFLPRPAAKAGH